MSISTTNTPRGLVPKVEKVKLLCRPFFFTQETNMGYEELSDEFDAIQSTVCGNGFFAFSRCCPHLTNHASCGEDDQEDSKFQKSFGAGEMMRHVVSSRPHDEEIALPEK
jgi:hypothetical protein